MGEVIVYQALQPPQTSSLKPPGPIKLKFHTETSQDAETKVCSNGPGQMTKMAATPIMVKSIKKLLLQNQKADDLGT